MTQNPTPVHEPIELDLEITQLEQEITALKRRHFEIEVAHQEQIVLQRQQNDLKSIRHHSPEVKQELAKIRSRLDELDLVLESRLLNLWEPFWQAVRFGGLGIIIGWMMRSWN